MKLELAPSIWRRGGTNPMQYRPSLYLSADRGVYQDAAVQFVAVDKSHLAIADASQTGLDVGTKDLYVGGWFTFDSLAAARTLWSKLASNAGYELTANADGSLTVTLGDGTAASGSSAAGTVTTATWYYISAYADRSGNLLVKVNGETKITLDISARTGSINSTAAWVVGAQPAGAQYHDGQADSLMVFSAVDLSGVASDIETWSYNGGSGRLCAEITAEQKAAWGAVSGWELGESSGRRYDSWGTNHLDQQFGDIISPTVNNGGFETLGEVFDSWTQNVSGTSSVNAETNPSHVYAGDTACRIDIDSSNSLAQIYQTLTGGKLYTYSLYAKGASGAPTIAITSGDALSSHTLTTVYQLFSGQLVSHTDGKIYIKRNSAASNSIYIDDVTLRAAEIPRAPGIVRAIAANGDGVSYWQDQSAGAKHAAQITLAKRPTLVTSGINSRPVIRGDGVDDYLGHSAVSLTGAFAISAVFQSEANPSALTLLGKDANNYITLTDNTTVTVGIAGASQAFTVSAMGTDQHILTVTRGADNAVNVYLDGTVSSTGAKTVAGTLALEQVMANAGGYFAGDLAEVLVYDGAKSAAEVTRIHTYLAGRYGVTL